MTCYGQVSFDPSDKANPFEDPRLARPLRFMCSQPWVLNCLLFSPRPPPTPPRRQPKKQEWFYYYLRVIVQPLAGTAIVHIRWSRPSTLFSHVPHLPFSQLNLMGALAARTTSFRR